MVELARVEKLVGRTAGNPEMDLALLVDEAVEVDAGGGDAEVGQGAAIESGENRAIFGCAHVEEFVAQGDQAGVGQTAGGGVETGLVIEAERVVLAVKKAVKQAARGESGLDIADAV